MWGAALMGGHQTQVAGNLTIGTNGSTRKGFIASSFGSVNPASIDGRSIVGIYDEDTGTPTAVLRISDFVANPGQEFLVSVTVGSITRFGVDATYSSLSPSDGFWTWPGSAFGLAAAGVTPFTIRTI